MSRNDYNTRSMAARARVSHRAGGWQSAARLLRKLGRHAEPGRTGHGYGADLDVGQCRVSGNRGPCSTNGSTPNQAAGTTDAVYDEEDGDYYVPPTFSDPGSGFTVEADYGQQLILKAANGNNPSPSWYGPVVINPTEGQGASVYRENIRTCDMTRWSPDSWMTVEPGNMVGPTRQGVNDLVALDWGASWDPDRDNGPGMPPGGPVGGCMSAHTCDISPRVGVLPVVDTGHVLQWADDGAHRCLRAASARLLD